MRLRIFVDFWNFTLAWKERTAGNTDWKSVPTVLTAAAQAKVLTAGLGTLSLEETRVYAGYDPVREAKLRGWLDTFLDRQPGVRVFTTERRWKQRAVHCRECGKDTVHCPACNKPFGRAAEKAIDAMIVTDVLSLAWENVYDVGILVSSDKDFIPAVDKLQTRNFKIINAHWSGHGHELARVCWASFEMDPLIASLTRS